MGSNRSHPTDLLYLDSTMIVELPSFTSCPVDSHPEPVIYAVTAVLNNRMMVCGGAYQSACYSLTGGSWTEEPGMLEKRAFAASSIWPGHGLLVTGGDNGDDRLSSTEYLSTSSGQWTPGPVLPVVMRWHCQVTAGSDVIITGGDGTIELASAYKLSADGSSWTSLPNMATTR